MKIEDSRAINTDEEHAAALREIEKLWHAKTGTPEMARLNRLVDAVVEYEEERWPMPEPSEEAIAAFRAEQEGVKI